MEAERNAEAAEGQRTPTPPRRMPDSLPRAKCSKQWPAWDAADVSIPRLAGKFGDFDADVADLVQGGCKRLRWRTQRSGPE